MLYIMLKKTRVQRVVDVPSEVITAAWLFIRYVTIGAAERRECSPLKRNLSCAAPTLVGLG